MKSNRSGRSGLGAVFGNFGGGGAATPYKDPFGEREDDDMGGDAVEMMNLGAGAANDVIRQEYIAEPTKRNSLFNENPDLLPQAKIVEMSSSLCIIKMIIAIVSFGLTTIFFKAIGLHMRYTIWEDVYARGIVFFACSIVQYLF
jgi:hypothetical protein